MKNYKDKIAGSVIEKFINGEFSLPIDDTHELIIIPQSDDNSKVENEEKWNVTAIVLIAFMRIVF